MREAAAPGFGLFLLPADGPVGASSPCLNRLFFGRPDE
jgi:hypothetical protein